MESRDVAICIACTVVQALIVSTAVFISQPTEELEELKKEILSQRWEIQRHLFTLPDDIQARLQSHPQLYYSAPFQLDSTGYIRVHCFDCSDKIHDAVEDIKKRALSHA